MATDTPPPQSTMPNGVIPGLNLAGRSSKASAFYQRAFGAREVARIPSEDDPSLMMHVHLELNGGAITLGDRHPDPDFRFQPSSSYTFMVDVPDGQVWWDRAVAAGCEVLMPYKPMFWGASFGQLKDPFGIQWAINSAGK